MKMKLFVKLVLAGSALAASAAYANTVSPTTGNGELVLYALDTNTNISYARGLQIQIDSVMTRSTIAGDSTYVFGSGTVNYSLPTIAPDANMTAFLAGAAGHTVVWAIQAGDSQQNLNTAGAERYLSTSALNLQVQPPVTNGVIRTVYNQIDGTQADMIGNTATPPGDGQSRITTAPSGGVGPGWGAGGTDNSAPNWFGGGPDSRVALGSAGGFYVLTTGGGSIAAKSRVYQAISVQLDANGTLHSVGAVPLPAAVWLFGSGVLGLIGIGRRRQSAVVTA
jgi:hypothetical protein